MFLQPYCDSFCDVVGGRWALGGQAGIDNPVVIYNDDWGLCFTGPDEHAK